MWIDKRGVVHSDGRSGDHLLRVELQNGREVRMSLFIFRREERRRRLMHEEKRSEWKDSRKRTTTVCNISNVKRNCESGVKQPAGYTRRWHCHPQKDRCHSSMVKGY